MKYWFICAAFLIPSAGWSQQKMDLDDIQIQGELHSDERLRLIAREQNRLRNFVEYRTHYRNEMIEGLMRPEPIYQFNPLGPDSGEVELPEQ